MRYWDSSALVPLIVAEPRTELARKYLREDPSIVTWAWTRVEITGAIERRAREGTITRSQRRELLNRLVSFANTWDEVTDMLMVRARAIALLSRHSLRAADAAQLAAALAVSDTPDSPMTFISFDDTLSIAAEREGLQVP